MFSWDIDNLLFVCSDETKRLKRRVRGTEIFTLNEVTKHFETDKMVVLISELSPYWVQFVENCEKHGLNIVIIEKEYYTRHLYKNSQEALQDNIKAIINKLSKKDDIWNVGSTKFYLPNYPADFIQSTIIETGNFYERDVLDDLEKYIPNNATIFDVGANIGNHTLFWGNKDSVKEIYAFEPVKDTYNILKKILN